MNLTNLFAKKEFSFGMKVNSNPINPSAINTELLFKLLAFPVWYRRFIKPIAKIAYEPNR